MLPHPLIAAGLAALLLSACAAMSEKECRSANWYEQGMRDALAGHTRTRLQDLNVACGEAGIVPDAAQYQAGWERGIWQFCSTDHAGRWGREGHGYANSCPPQIEGRFLAYYRLGRRAWEAEQKLQRLQSEQDSRERELSKANDDERRKQLRAQLHDLDHRLRHARDDLARAEREYRQASY